MSVSLAVANFREEEIRYGILKYEDPASRIFELLAALEPAIRDEFVEMVRQIQDSATLNELEQLIASGDINEALRNARVYVELFANQVNQAFITSAGSTATQISREVIVAFDQTNHRAVELLRAKRYELIAQITEEQRRAIRQALTAGTEAGLNPRDQARAFRDAIGLTQRQEAAVRNYRRLLEEGNSDVLNRQLRDRRFDRTVERSIRESKPLKSGQIDTMVSRYRERYIKYRAETIGRTEALEAVHQGAFEMYDQAIGEGKLDPSKLESQWYPANDSRVRDSHESMRGQVQPYGSPFVTGAGHLLRYPGDRLAPASETVQCRCAVSTRIREAA